VTVKLESPRWRDFQESLARMVGLGIGLLDSDGNILGQYNMSPGLTAAVSETPELRGRYAGFWSYCAKLARDQTQVVTDPLGLQYVCLPQNNGQLVLLGGAIDEAYSAHKVLRRFQSHGVCDPQQILTVLPRSSQMELIEKARNLEAIYTHVVWSSRETEELGTRALFLAGIQQINRLMVRMLSPSDFDLASVLDLVASSLLILLDAEGAWAFAAYHGEKIGAQRGMRQATLQYLRGLWDEAVDDDLSTAAIVNGPVGLQEGGTGHVETVDLSNDAIRVSLGLVNARSEHKQAALDIFREQVAIAVEIATLYESLQRQLGTLLESLRHGFVMFNRECKLMSLNGAARRFLEVCGIS